MQVVDVHVVQLHRCCSWIDGMAFEGRVHRYTARGFPAIWARKGWRGRRELAPRCSATQLGACSCVHIDRDMFAIPSSVPHTPHKGFAQDNRCVALIASPLAVTMLLHGERASGTSARRRRERRLRSWAKHQRMSIAIALAENLHHSRQKVEGNASDVPTGTEVCQSSWLSLVS